ncbi:acyltransferase [Pseudopedobacter sp.]|uniref:acyltransferase n=1 Tax=Pseudopedobacter sp. TaxID=1936787 RepID=UPI0033421556
MKKILKKIVLAVPFFLYYYNLKRAIPHANFLSFLNYKLFQKQPYWVVDKSSEIKYPENIFVGKNSLIGTRPRCYIQGYGGIYFGNYIQIGPNAAVMSVNHETYDQRKASLKSVIIDDYCWIGTGAIVLPGVILGKRTIVAAGAVVTKSFKEGYCIIGGNPAKVIRTLDKEQFLHYEEESQYYGYVEKTKFESKYKKEYLRSISELIVKNSIDPDFAKFFFERIIQE